MRTLDVFVYGTLLSTSGFWGANAIVGEPTPARIGGSLYDVGYGYPYAICDDTEPFTICGEVQTFDMDHPQWERIVKIEVNAGYMPRAVKAETATGGVLRVVVFDTIEDNKALIKRYGVRVVGGDWTEYVKRGLHRTTEDVIGML